MHKEQTKTEKNAAEKVLEKATGWFNPYNRKHMLGFLAVVAITAGAAGYYGLRDEKKVEKKK